jgi:toxin ParE1/3/4
MSFRIQQTAHAQEDIEQISLWIARQGSVQAALNWYQAINQEFLKLAETPGTGTDQGDLRPGLRSSPFKNYLIFFNPTRTGIQIIRVIHGARDYKRFFE